MSFSNWLVQPEQVFSASPLMPVVQIRDIEQAIPLANALFCGGLCAVEVALRTDCALEVVRLLTATFPEAMIGVGTVTTPDQLDEAIAAGAKFAFSPGQTQALLEAGSKACIPFIPGIASISELMEGLVLGYTHFKFFPAAVAGGIPMLRAIYAPFPQACFCPTGGITQENCSDYLALPNVSCVGGSWVVPEEAIKKGDWALITDLCCKAGNALRGWG